MDRNISREISLIRPYASLSARRAWIEIWVRHRAGPRKWVALRKESVDRNIIRVRYYTYIYIVALRKESVDRNPPIWTLTTHKTVALRKESVDRNTTIITICIAWKSRSPQGERG